MTSIYLLIAVACFTSVFYRPAKVLFARQKLFRDSKKLAAAGDIEGTAHLGFCYEMGYGFKKNPHKAKEIYMKAAKMGSKFAQLKLMDRGPGKKVAIRKTFPKADLSGEEQKMIQSLLNSSRKD